MTEMEMTIIGEKDDNNFEKKLWLWQKMALHPSPEQQTSRKCRRYWLFKPPHQVLGQVHQMRGKQFSYVTTNPVTKNPLFFTLLIPKVLFLILVLILFSQIDDCSLHIWCHFTILGKLPWIFSHLLTPRCSLLSSDLHPSPSAKGLCMSWTVVPVRQWRLKCARGCDNGTGIRIARTGVSSTLWDSTLRNPWDNYGNNNSWYSTTCRCRFFLVLLSSSPDFCLLKNYIFRASVFQFSLNPSCHGRNSCHVLKYNNSKWAKPNPQKCLLILIKHLNISGGEIFVSLDISEMIQTMFGNYF